MVVGNQEICALTYINLNKFTRQWSTYLLAPLTLKWVLIGTNQWPLDLSRYFT